MKTAPKFKGRLDNGEWVEGCLVTNGKSGAFIKVGLADFHTVDPATVEQIGGDLFEENKRLRDALKEISKCEGAFDTDPLKHAGNCINNMCSIAEEALKGEMK